MRVFLDVPRWFVRPKNTDWRYVRYNLPRLGEFCPGVEAVLPREPWYGWRESALYIGHRVFRGFSIGQAMADISALNISKRAVEGTGAQVVFGHGRFPRRAGRPVVWQHSILDPRMQQARGVAAEQIQAERNAKMPLFESSAAVQVSTRLEAERLGEWMPHLREKFVAVPFFLPDLRALPVDEVRAKHSESGPLRILFVGNEARRKGLDTVLLAFAEMDKMVRERTRLDIVSAMTDGAIDIPAAENICFHGAKPHARVISLMNAAHIFVMPSRFESYGLAYIEALAAGAVPIGPVWENQREILANGSAGLLTDGSVAGVAEALDLLVRDGSLRMRLAMAGRSRFEEEFAPAAVAVKYQQLFEQVLRQ